MFITAVCVLFLIKLRWPKSKSIYVTEVYCESVNLIGYITVFYLLIENSYASVHIAHHVWTVLFYALLDIFFLFMQWDYGKFVLKQLEFQ